MTRPDHDAHGRTPAAQRQRPTFMPGKWRCSPEDARLGIYPLVGGTAWLFARPEHDQQFDYLFVDEAGQVSLANIVATGAAARNIVLVGDPMQLAQPIQGVHPGQSGISALAYILNGVSTLPQDRGVFLPVTRRLHPLICDYISRVVYDGRLKSDNPAASQQLILQRPRPPLVPAGLRFAGIAHAGNSQSSAEEGKAILDVYRSLVRQMYQDRDGNQRIIGAADILVVTPYNAQVNLLTRMLPAGARVGTVDKFQGQEAPVCLISMATSSADELPRNIEFLFSVNRLNVAISRAQALAIVFASPRLLDVPCRTIEQMRLVNALAAVKGQEFRSSGITTGAMIAGNGFSIYRRDHKIIHKLTIAFNTLTKLALRPAKRSKSS